MKPIFVILTFWISFDSYSQVEVSHVFKAMGSRFEITVVSSDSTSAYDLIEKGKSEIDRIENIISSWNPNSQTSAINRQAGERAVKVSKELFELIERSIYISKLTQGAFDITYASMDKVWYFDGRMTELPSSEEIRRSVAKIGYSKILLEPENYEVMLMEAGMKIGFGGIGKGYAAHAAAELLKQKGAKGGMVNAGGDLYAWGLNIDRQDWVIGLADPRNKSKILAWLNISNQAIVTSGDYEKFVTFQGKRYAHIIDPRTGWPTTGIKSVSVICANPEMGDALATSVFVLGKEHGLYLINQLPNTECILVTDDDAIITSDNLNLNYVQNQ